MTSALSPVFILAAIAGLATGAMAQTAAPASTAPLPAGTASRGGGLGALLGGAVPDIGAIGAGNAAGLLGYCLNNNLLGGAGGALAGVLPGAGTMPVAPGATTAPLAPGAAPGAPAAAGAAQSILQRLTGRQGVRNAPGFAAGQAGRVQTGTNRTFPLDSLRGQARTQVCNLVLNRARSFL